MPIKKKKKLCAPVLGKFFSYKDMTMSMVAIKNGIDNTPNETAMENLRALLLYVLDPLQLSYGKRIRVISGYRCKELNTLMNGTTKSLHMKGQAADIMGNPPSIKENKKLMQLILDLNLPFYQLIEENGGKHIHVSYKLDGWNKKQVLHF